MTEGGQSELNEDQAIQIARALASPVRRHIVDLFIGSEPIMTSTIVDSCGLARSSVSRHIRVLREAGLLVPARQGVRIWYRLNRALLDAYASRLGELAAGH